MGGNPRLTRIRLYTIPGLCPLCDEAREKLHEMGLASEIEEIDIRTSRELLRAYRNEIPVVEVDGVKRFIGRVDERGLRGLLGSAPDSS